MNYLSKTKCFILCCVRDLKAKGKPAPRSGSMRYPISQLREDYRKQWGKPLVLTTLAFGNLVELLEWDLFSDIVRVEDAALIGETG